MAKIKEIRSKIDTKLDQWEDIALAFEANLDATRDEALNRVEAQKKKLGDVLAQIKNKVDQSAELAQESKNKIQGDLEHLQVQLALGKADARGAYEDQKQKITNAIMRFEDQLESELEEWDETLNNKWVQAQSTLEAELEAAEIQFKLEKAQKAAEFNQKKQDITDNIHSFLDIVEEKRRTSADKLATFEGEFSAGIKQVKQAVHKLFSDA
jgi:multidrug efflux pump subunit AcrA (membrane-fusion protein)